MSCAHCPEPATHEIHDLRTGERRPVCLAHRATVFDCNRPVELYALNPSAGPSPHPQPVQ